MILMAPCISIQWALRKDGTGSSQNKRKKINDKKSEKRKNEGCDWLYKKIQENVWLAD